MHDDRQLEIELVTWKQAFQRGEAYRPPLRPPHPYYLADFWYFHPNPTALPEARALFELILSGVCDTIVEALLFWTPPFLDLSDSQLRDVQPKSYPPLASSQRLHPCQDRRALFKGLSDALIHYEITWRVVERTPQDIVEHYRKNLASLRMPLDVFRSHGRRRSHRTVPSAFQVVGTIVNGLTAEDYSRVQCPQAFRPRAIYTRLRRDMCHAFESYGPRNYADVSIYYAVAAILTYVGIMSHADNPSTGGSIQRHLARYP